MGRRPLAVASELVQPEVLPAGLMRWAAIPLSDPQATASQVLIDLMAQLLLDEVAAI